VWVIGKWVRRMVVPMVMPVIMVVLVIMIVLVWLISFRANTLDVMMMTRLRFSDLGFETDHLVTIFAELTVHVGIAFQHAFDAIGEGVDHQFVVI
jgi:hypothetical protein